MRFDFEDLKVSSVFLISLNEALHLYTVVNKNVVSCCSSFQLYAT